MTMAMPRSFSSNLSAPSGDSDLSTVNFSESRSSSATNTWGSSSTTSTRSFSLTTCRMLPPRGGRQRNSNGCGRAAPHCTAEVERAPVFFDDGVRNRQTEPGPLPYRLRREEWLEDPLGEVFWDALPGVGHFDDVGIADCARRDGHRAGTFDGVDRVRDEVHDRLIEQTGKTVDDVRFTEVGLDLDSVLQPVMQNEQDRLHAFADAHLLPLAFVEA